MTTALPLQDAGINDHSASLEPTKPSAELANIEGGAPIIIYGFTELTPILEKLKAKNDTVVFEYATKAGDKEARSWVYSLRKTKTAVDGLRKELKADYLEKGKRIDADAKTVITELEAMIDVHQAPLDKIEQLRAALEAETKAKIEGLRYAVNAAYLTAQECRLAIERLEAERLTDRLEQWGEYENEVRAIIGDGLPVLASKLANLEQIERDRAELEELRKAKAKKDAAESAESARIEAERLAKEKTDQEARNAELDKMRVENERLAKIAADAEAAKQLAADAKTEEERRESSKRNRNAVHKKIEEHLMLMGGLTPKSAQAAVEALQQCQNVKILY